MELDYENGWFLGKVDHQLGDHSARIAVIGKLNNTFDQLTQFNKNDILEIFPPKGFVFAPKIIKSLIEEKTFIKFKIAENEYSKPGGDIYVSENKTISKFAHKLLYINLSLKQNFIDLSSLNGNLVNLINDHERFYIKNNHNVLGPFEKIKDTVVSINKNSTNLWEDSEIPYYDNLHNSSYGIILSTPQENNIVDCMNNEQLSSWFLKECENKLKITKSRKEKQLFRKEFEAYTEIIDPLSQIRFKRVFDVMDQIELDTETLYSFAENSEKFAEIFKEFIKCEKENILKEKTDDIKAKIKLLEDGHTEKQENLDIEFNKKIKKNKDNEKKLLASVTSLEKRESLLNDRLKELEKSGKYLKENKERLLEDFTVFKSIGQNDKPSNIPASLLEVVSGNDNEIFIKNKFINNLQYHLEGNKINFIAAEDYSYLFQKHKCLFIPDAVFAIPLIKSFGNLTYLIQQVEADWLHFQDFWNNGLSLIWQSALENKDQLHLLLLEDINLAAPECWGRPLFDMLSGLRKRVPFAETEFPQNLKIIFTKIDLSIGLPLNPNTFIKCGGIGKGEEFYSDDAEFVKDSFVSFKEFNEFDFQSADNQIEQFMDNN